MFKDNELDNYDLTTYHIKFFMVSEYDFVNGNLDSPSKVVIAESGVTSQIFVEELDFTSYISLNKTARNSNAVNFQLTMREFSGATLIDKIFAASLELGINNYMQCPYMIEISFRARSTETGEPYTPKNLRWIYPVLIQGIETNVSIGGAAYEVKAFTHGAIGQKSEFGTLAKALKVENATEMKDATDQMADILDKQESDKSATNTSLPNKYEITYPNVNPATGELTTGPNEIASFRLGKGHPADASKTVSTKTGDNADGTKKNPQFTAGMSVQDAINTLLTNSPDYQKNALQTDGSAATGESDPTKMKILHKVITKSEMLDYDNTRGDYQRKFIYQIVPYKMGTLIAGTSDANANGATKYNLYKHNGLLEKRYQYLYTGQNDQIIEFDIKFNQSWYVNMPSQGGVATSMSSTTEGSTFNMFAADYHSLKADIAAFTANRANLKGSSDNDVKALESKINTSFASAEEKAELNKLLKTATTPRMDPAAPSNYGKNTVLRKQTSKNTNTSVIAGVNYVSDFNLDVTLHKLTPIRFAEVTSSQVPPLVDYINNIESSKTAGRKRVNSLFDQAFSGNSGDLVNIELIIKGDPYWMGPPNATEPVPGPGTGAQVFMMFSTRTPELPDVDTGLINNRPTAMNGIYAVRQVDHRFANGQFTQTLFGVREPAIKAGDTANDE